MDEKSRLQLFIGFGETVIFRKESKSRHRSESSKLVSRQVKKDTDFVGRAVHCGGL